MIDINNPFDKYLTQLDVGGRVSKKLNILFDKNESLYADLSIVHLRLIHDCNELCSNKLLVNLYINIFNESSMIMVKYYRKCTLIYIRIPLSYIYCIYIFNTPNKYIGITRQVESFIPGAKIERALYDTTKNVYTFKQKRIDKLFPNRDCIWHEMGYSEIRWNKQKFKSQMDNIFKMLPIITALIIPEK